MAGGEVLAGAAGLGDSGHHLARDRVHSNEELDADSPS